MLRRLPVSTGDGVQATALNTDQINVIPVSAVMDSAAGGNDTLTIDQRAGPVRAGLVA